VIRGGERNQKFSPLIGELFQEVSMREIPWRAPLAVTLQSGIQRRFCGPYDALDFLEHEWPIHGSRYKRAVSDCRAAISRAQNPDISRASFIGACVEASLRFTDLRARAPRSKRASAG
jgi:hypothetical protein